MEPIKFHKDGQPGREVVLDSRFSWNGCAFRIPAVYLCDEGLVTDTILEADRERMAAFLDKWRYLFERERSAVEPTRREKQQFQQENPLGWDYWCQLECNGSALQYKGGNGRHWIPSDLNPIFENDQEMPAFMERYGLPPDRVWRFRRDRFCWTQAGGQELRTLVLTLAQRPVTYYGVEFAPKEAGEKIRIPNLLDGGTCVLTVQDIRREETPSPKEEGLLFPRHCVSMEYTLEPALPPEVFSLVDVQDSDQPRRVGKTDKIGGAIGVILRNREQSEHPAAVSALHFEPVESVTWQAIFRAKTVEDKSISLLG